MMIATLLRPVLWVALPIGQDVPARNPWPAQTAFKDCVNDEVFRRVADRAATPEAVAKASIEACDRLVDPARKEFLEGASNLDPAITRDQFVAPYEFAAEKLAEEALKRPRAASKN